jgi:hypothetical protein
MAGMASIPAISPLAPPQRVRIARHNSTIFGQESDENSPQPVPHRACLACLGGSLPDSYLAPAQTHKSPAELASAASPNRIQLSRNNINA